MPKKQIGQPGSGANSLKRSLLTSNVMLLKRFTNEGAKDRDDISSFVAHLTCRYGNDSARRNLVSILNDRKMMFQGCPWWSANPFTFDINVRFWPRLCENEKMAVENRF